MILDENQTITEQVGGVRLTMARLDPGSYLCQLALAATSLPSIPRRADPASVHLLSLLSPGSNRTIKIN